jgi:DNA polymerase III delta prime subunit
LIKSNDPLSVIISLNQKRKKRDLPLFDMEVFRQNFASEKKFFNFTGISTYPASWKPGAFSKHKRKKEKLIKTKKKPLDEHFNMSKREVNEEFAKLGLLHDSIVKKKNEARAQRKIEKKNVRKALQRKVDERRRETREFREFSVHQFDTHTRRMELGKAGRAGKQVREKKLMRKQKQEELRLKREEKKRKKQRALELFAGNKKYQRKNATRILTESEDVDTKWDFSNVIDGTTLFATFKDFLDTLKMQTGNIPEIPHVESIILSSCTLFYQLYRSRNGKDTTAALFQFGCAVTDFEQRETVVQLASDLIMDQCQQLMGAPTKIFSESLNVSSFVVALQTVLSSELVTSLRKFIVTIVSLKWFSKDTAKRLGDVFGKAAKMPLFDVLLLSLDGVLSLLRHGTSLLSGSSILDVILAEDPYVGIMREYEMLVAYKDFTYQGLPVEGMMERRSYRSKVEELSILTKSYHDEMGSTNPRKAKIHSVYISLVNLKLTMDRQLRSLKRVSPIGVLLSGPPGIGKSKLLEVFARVFSKVVGRTFSPEHIWSKPRTSQYWDGYQPASHPFLHISEAGNKAPSLVSKTGDDIITEITSLVDSLPFSCDMSSVEDKGKFYADPELVLIDTNNKTLNAEKLSICPSAIMRRFLHVEVKVKKEFMRDGSTSIDYTKSMDAGGNILDRYVWDIYEALPVGNMSFNRSSVYKGDSIDDMVHAIETFFRNHVAKESAVNSHDLYSFLDEKTVDDTDFEGSNDFVEQEFTSPEMEEKVFSESLDFNFHSAQNYYTKAVSIAAPYLDNAYSKFGPYVDCGRSFIASNYEGCIKHLKYYVGSIFKELLIWLMCAMLLDAFGSIKSDKRKITVFSISLAGFIFVPKITAIMFLAFMLCNVSVIERVKQRKYKSTCRVMTLTGKEYIPWQQIRVSIGVITALTLLIKAFRLMSTYKNKSESSSFYSSAAVDTNLIEVENKLGASKGYVRVKTSKHPVWNNATQVRGGVHHGSCAELESSLGRRNLLSCVVKTTKGQRSTHAFGILGNIAFINAHALAGCSNGTISYCRGSVYLQDNAREVDFSAANFVMGLNDICLIRLPKLQFNDIRKHLCKAVPVTSAGFLNGKKITFEFVDKKLELTDKYIGDFFLDCAISYNTPHFAGMCGLPIIGYLDTSTVGIIGFHAAGCEKGNVAFGTILTHEVLTNLVQKLNFKNIQMPILSEAGFELTQLPGNKSAFRFEHFKNLDYLGHDGKPVLLNNKSKIHKSAIADMLPSFFQNVIGKKPTDYFYPPMMKPKHVKGEYFSPYNINLNKMNTDPPTLDEFVLGRCIDEVTKRIITRLSEVGVKQLSPLELESAINGVKDDPFISRINASTSSGYGFTGVKTKYLPLMTDMETREPTSDLKIKIYDVFRKYENEESAGFIFGASLKDEPRTYEKSVTGKTRMFYMSPLHYLCTARMLLSPFYSLMVEHSEVFYTAVGINMHSQSDELIRRLSNHSSNFMEGDYSGYDVSNPFEISHASATVVLNVLTHLGYNDYALNATRGILTDGLYPVVSVLGDIFIKPGMQPSGKYATAEDNSLRGLLMLMYAFYMDPVHVNLDFF